MDCLGMFTEEEMLTGNEKAYCGKCKKHQSSVKKLSFFRLPKVLALHVKRFSPSGHKLLNELSFPCDHLDMSSFVQPEAIPLNKQPKYKLVGIVQHFGGVGGGHYKCICRREDDTWLSFNDSIVNNASDAAVRNASQAYMLFYVQE